MASGATLSSLAELESYLVEARDAGCPADQVENFCRAGIVLQPRQLAASAAARLCDHRCGACERAVRRGDEPRIDCPDCGPTEVGYGGARGGGKSHWGIAQVVADDCTRFPGLKFLYLRKVGKAGKEAVQDLRREVLHSTPHEYKAGDNVITLPNGSRVILGHFQTERDIDSYLGLQYDGVLVEEATQLTSRKVRDIGTCIRSTKPGWRPRKYFTTNPGNVGHAWFKSRFIEPLRAGRERATRFIQATVRDNRFVNPEYRAELDALTGWQRRAWLDGDWDIAAGQYFTTFRREVHGVGPIKVLANWQVWIGLDYGFTHYTSAHLLAKNGDGMKFAVDEHAARGMLVGAHCEAILAMLERNKVPLARIRLIAAGGDCFGKKHTGGTIADDYRANRLKLTPANDDRLNGAAEILRLLGDPDKGKAPRLQISGSCPMLLECLPALQHDPHRPEDVLKVDCDDDGLGGDDPYDSFRYGIMADAARRPAVAVEC
jgi:phage terminase large subunit